MIRILLAIAALGLTVPARHPRIAHFMPYLFGDSLRAIRRAKRLRYRYVDQNMHATRDGLVFVLHWPKWWRQYRWRWTGRRARGREVRERAPRRAKVQHMLGLEVGRLRSRKRGGTRPYQARLHMQHAADLDITLCLEAKNSPRGMGFDTPEVWERLAQARDETGARVIIMTLQNQGGTAAALRRLELAHAAGFPVALLPRGKRPAPGVVPDYVHWWGKGKRP